MRVKRLEVQGFKSFKDKTIIHFDHTITGIVGPNGCGKSNIVDAFFWVMGEQSYKHMRGSGSGDLIFNGSSKYSPLGMAEATLVMETEAVDTENAPAGATVRDIPLHLQTKEISVTRRVYRGGEGEYLINGVTARLKDIQELFMDTGVGAKGYSIIEQGQIGKIVNAKPEERRLLIEEAAGIAKYKARKKESLRKMEATQGNLSRLNDVIQEIERNLNSLERQAHKARQYKTYKEELLDKEMTWGRRKATVLNQKLSKISSQRIEIEQDLAGVRAELQTAENAIESDRTSQLTDTKEAEEFQAKINELSAELARAQSALDLSRRRQQDLGQQLQSLSVERQELELAISAESERLTGAEASFEECRTAHDEALNSVREKSSQVAEIRTQTQSSRAQLEGMQRELMNGVAQASDLKSRAASLDGRIESAQAQSDKISAQLATQRERVHEAKAEVERSRVNARSMQEKLSELREEKTRQQDRIRSLEGEFKQAEAQRKNLSDELTRVRSRLQSLEELAEAHEGFGDGPKAALEFAKQSGTDSQVCAIADLMEIESGYEAALEGWLEGRLESLVCEDLSVSWKLAEQVREAQQGRVSIQVATNGSTGVAGSNLDSLGSLSLEILGPLSSFVRASQNGEMSQFGEGVVRSLTESVTVVRDLSSLAGIGIGSENIASILKSAGTAIVDLSGRVLDPAGLIRGGSLQCENSASVLGRKRAISELQEKVSEKEAQLLTAENAVRELSDRLSESRASLQVLQDELQEAQIAVAGIERDVHAQERALRESEGQLESLEKDLQSTATDRDTALQEKSKIEDQISGLVARRQEIESQLGGLEQDVAQMDAVLRSEEEELQAIRVREASLSERAQSLERELRSAKSMAEERQRRLQEVERTLERAGREHQEHTGGDEGLEQAIVAKTQAIAEAKEQLSLIKDRLEQAGSRLGGEMERIKALRSAIDQKSAESTQLALDFERFTGELSHLIQNLEEKYGVGCLERPVTSPIQEEMEEPVVTAEMSEEEERLLGEEVEKLKERIRRLGEVNTMAIEEFEELKKRHEHLIDERKDLEVSIENLQDAIEHINKTSEQRFERAFEAIATRFEKLFPIIFGGGQARLSLVYPEGSNDILEAGVDILAQPPGKKVVNIGLLSGGEKALTAVSLIFAIFMVKPSPFCILDEVDAPLDDANIGKFNTLLREMSAKSQFILITHNKKTMELNDTLYGVTMEEPGVSKMVSIEMH